MAVNAYLYIDGVSGPSTSKAGLIDVLSFSWGVSQTQTYGAAGDILKKVYILYDKPVGTEQQDYFRIYLQDALITSVQLSGSNENPTESVSFAFQAVEVAYKPEKDDGTLDAAIPKGFDLATLKSDYAAPDSF
jgi:type VI secretion system secreted protein Hcp